MGAQVLLYGLQAHSLVLHRPCCCFYPVLQMLHPCCTSKLPVLYPRDGIKLWLRLLLLRLLSPLCCAELREPLPVC
jgi:hypothetical protein